MGLVSLTNLINTNIRNAVNKIIKEEHADVDQAIVDSLFEPDTGYTVNQGGLSINYNIKKLGNIVYIHISCLNTTDSYISGVDFTLDNKYAPKFRVLMANPEGADYGLITNQFTAYNVFRVKNVPAFSHFYINQSYISNNN